MPIRPNVQIENLLAAIDTNIEKANIHHFFFSFLPALFPFRFDSLPDREWGEYYLSFGRLMWWWVCEWELSLLIFVSDGLAAFEGRATRIGCEPDPENVLRGQRDFQMPTNEKRSTPNRLGSLTHQQASIWHRTHITMYLPHNSAKLLRICYGIRLNKCLRCLSATIIIIMSARVVFIMRIFIGRRNQNVLA